MPSYFSGTADTFGMNLSANEQVDVLVTYSDHYGQQTAEGSALVTYNTTGDKTLVTGPETDGWKRRIESVTGVNRGAGTQTVTLRQVIGGTAYQIGPALTLLTGEAFRWSPEQGFQLYQAGGLVKV